MMAFFAMSANAQLPSDSIGKTIDFGSFYTDSSKEKSSLRWRVVSCTKSECLLTTDYIVIIGPYHSVEKDVTWKDSDIRYWLNHSFYNKSFSQKEKEMIVLYDVKAEDNPIHHTSAGEDTKDKVFILSAAQANLLNEDHRKVMATAYASEKAGRTYSNLYDVWWLRNPGLRSVHAMVVGGGNTPSGFIRPNGLLVNVEFVGVRPAIVIKNEPLSQTDN